MMGDKLGCVNVQAQMIEPSVIADEHGTETSSGTVRTRRRKGGSPTDSGYYKYEIWFETWRGARVVWCVRTQWRRDGDARLG